MEVHPERERVVVVPRGELDLSTVDRLGSEIDDLVSAGFSRVVLDLRALDFMDSTGLRLVLEQTGRADVSVGVVDGTAPIARLFDITGLRERLPFVPADERPAPPA